MTIRTLPPDEWPRLDPIMRQHGARLPHQDLARILVAEDGPALIGFLVMQLQPHLEPIWVDPAHRGTGVSIALALAAKQQFPDKVAFYAFAPSPRIEALATRAGLTKLPWSVFRGQRGDEDAIFRPD